MKESNSTQEWPPILQNASSSYYSYCDWLYRSSGILIYLLPYRIWEKFRGETFALKTENISRNIFIGKILRTTKTATLPFEFNHIRFSSLICLVSRGQTVFLSLRDARRRAFSAAHLRASRSDKKTVWPRETMIC